MNIIKTGKIRSSKFLHFIGHKKRRLVRICKSKLPGLIKCLRFEGWEGKASIDYFIFATQQCFVVDKDCKIIGKPMTYEEVQKSL